MEMFKFLVPGNHILSFIRYLLFDKHNFWIKLTTAYKRNAVTSWEMRFIFFLIILFSFSVYSLKWYFFFRLLLSGTGIKTLVWFYYISELYPLASSQPPRTASENSAPSLCPVSLWVPNGWITFSLLFVFFFQQCGHLACLTVLTCQVKNNNNKKSTFTPDMGCVVSVNHIHLSACLDVSKKKIEKLSSKLWSVKQNSLPISEQST